MKMQQLLFKLLFLLSPVSHSMADAPVLPAPSSSPVEITLMSQLRQGFRELCADCRVEFRDIKIPEFSKEDAADLKVNFQSLKWGGGFLLPVEFLGQTQAYISGQVRLYRQGLQTTRSLNAIQPVQLADVKTEWIDVTFLKDDLANEKDLQGAVTRAFIGLRRPLLKSDLRLPQIVSRGQIVKVTHGTDSFEVETQMKAEESGSLGDLIRVRGEGNRVLSVRVTEPGAARLE